MSIDTRPITRHPVAMPSDLLDTAAVAELAGVKVETIRMYLFRGTIPPPHQRIGQSPVWKRRTIETWIATRRTVKGPQ